MFGYDETPLIPSAFPNVLVEEPLEILNANLPCSRLVHDSNDNQSRVPSRRVKFRHLCPRKLNRAMKPLQARDRDIAKIVLQVTANGFEVRLLSTELESAD